MAIRAQKPTVLIVDDEPDILLMLRLNLESEGFTTLLAGDGETALRRVREESPEVMVLDVMMPLLDGWGVLEGLGTVNPRPKVVVLTAKDTPRDAQRAEELGANMFLNKPFDPGDLIGAIETVMGAAHNPGSAIPPVYEARSEPHGTGTSSA